MYLRQTILFLLTPQIAHHATLPQHITLTQSALLFAGECLAHSHRGIRDPLSLILANDYFCSGRFPYGRQMSFANDF